MSDASNCYTCRFEDVESGQHPCGVCDEFDCEWQPLPVNTEDGHTCDDCLHKDVLVGKEPCKWCFKHDEKPQWTPMPPSEPDPVNNPAHYTQGSIEVLDFIEGNPYLTFHAATIIQYLCRHKFKNGIEDLKKARYYLNRLISLEEPKHE